MAVVVLPHHFGPSITTAPFASNFACKIRSTTLALYSLMIVTPLPSAYPLFRTRAILFGDLAVFRSAGWRYFVRRLGLFSFGDLAVFRSACWRYFVQRLGLISFGGLAVFRSACWRNFVRRVGAISFGVLAKEKRYRLAPLSYTVSVVRLTPFPASVRVSLKRDRPPASVSRPYSRCFEEADPRARDSPWTRPRPQPAA